MVFSPTLLYQGYEQLHSNGGSKSAKQVELRRSAPPNISYNETLRVALRAMSEEEHSSVLAPLKGRNRRRMAREIAKITHERHLKVLRSGLL